MEKTKKTTKATPVAKKAAPVKEKQVKAEKVEKVERVQPKQPVQEKTEVAEVKAQSKKPVTLNQELNLLVGFLSLITIICFCFAFQGGDTEILGWELVLKSGEYSGVFKGLMVLYVATIFIDCILAIRIDSENEVFNIVEKVLYMFSAIMNFVVIAVLLSLISKIGIGLIIFFIISAVSVIIKFARIFTKR